ncbi:hypothetical protein [Luteibacter aegosomatissinici]|uniref:hypothetical protein n=1 Tax=Luteibacter aegosomatissinici TaxID=2911539 RepID=UPI001FFA69FA|nr:hypothetical protein [Luteibacter aegosomatissinici]UPG92813.1 hypothetical protein L2Y97_13155 [Luteibacter aegosomatissinici]
MATRIPAVETFQHVAKSMRLRLSEPGRSKRGKLDGTCFVLVDEDRDAVAVCDTLRDLTLEFRWRIVHILTDHGPERFRLAMANGVMTLEEFLAVAGDLPPALGAPFERGRLEAATPGATSPVLAAKRL